MLTQVTESALAQLEVVLLWCLAPLGFPGGWPARARIWHALWHNFLAQSP